MPTSRRCQIDAAVAFVEFYSRIPAECLEIDAPATGSGGVSLHMLEELLADASTAICGPNVQIFHVEGSTVRDTKAFVVAERIADDVGTDVLAAEWRAMSVSEEGGWEGVELNHMHFTA